MRITNVYWLDIQGLIRLDDGLKGYHRRVTFLDKKESAINYKKRLKRSMDRHGLNTEGCIKDGVAGFSIQLYEIPVKNQMGSYLPLDFDNLVVL